MRVKITPESPCCPLTTQPAPHDLQDDRGAAAGPPCQPAQPNSTSYNSRIQSKKRPASLCPGSPTEGAGSSSDALYKELWHAWARPLITVPRQGEIIYYFPHVYIGTCMSHRIGVFSS
ncbi:hypothetical protein ACQJBY_065681 [Aegilops geniculata]